MTSRRKTIAIALAVVLIGGSAGAYFVARDILIHRLNSWRAQGIAASVAGDNEKAVTLLSRYLNRRPQDEEALSYYVNSREMVPLPNGQHLAQTVDGLKMLLALDPNRMDDRRHLMKLYYRLDRLPEALDLANAMLTKLPKDLVALEIKTQALTRLNENHEAMDAADAWAAAGPTLLPPQMMRIALEQRLGRSSDLIVTDVTMQRESHPGDPRFEFLEGFAYEQVGDNANATHWLKLAAGHSNLQKDLVQLLVVQLDLQGLGTDSVTLMERAEKESGDADLRLALGRRYWEMHRWKDVAAILQAVDPNNPASDATTIALKADALANLGQTSDSEVCKKALAARTDPASRAWASILNQSAEPSPADIRNTVHACAAAASIDPTNPYYFYFLGASYAQLGEVDLAIVAYRRSMDLDIAWSLPPARLVEALLFKGRPDQAFDVATTAAQRGPTNAAAILALARAWSAGVENGCIGKADELLKIVLLIEKDLPNDDQMSLIQVQLLARQGQKAEASGVALEKLFRKQPPSESFFLAVVALSHRYGLEIQQQCMDKWRTDYGVTPLLAYASAVDRLLDGHGDEGLSLFGSLANQSGHAGDLAWKLPCAKYLDISRDPSAKTAWVALRDAYPNDLSVQQAVVSAQTVQGDWGVLQTAIDHLHALTGDNALAWRVAQARLLVESPRTDQDSETAAVQLNKLVQLYPDSAEIHVLLARDLVRLQRIDAAVEQFTTASKLDPTDVAIALQLASLLQSQGDFQRVQDELDKISPQLRSDSDREQVAILLDKQGQDAKASQLLEQMPSTVDESSDARNNADLLLAYLYRRRHDYPRAEVIIGRLLQHPNSVVVELAASIYTDEGKTSQAEQALRTLDTLKLPPGIKEILWGSHYAQTGDFADAAPHYLAATRERGAPPLAWQLLAACQFGLGQRDQAVATIAAGLKANPKDQGLSLLAQQSDLLYAGAQDSRLDPIVTAIVRDPVSDSADLELLRTIVQAWGSNDSQLLATRLQDFVGSHADSLNGQVQLMECYETMGRAADAVSVAHKAVNAFPTDLEVVRSAVKICELSRQWSDLSEFAQELKRRSPGDAQEADTALAMADVGQNQPDAAVSALAPYLSAAKANPDQNVDLLSLYACATAEAGNLQEASDLIWPLALAEPQWRQRWVGIARGLPDSVQAVAWLDRLAAAMPSGDPDLLASIAEAYNELAAVQHDATLTQKSSRLFATVAASPTASASSLILAGLQAEGCSDWSRARADYRLALQHDPASYVAANNLAMLLIRHGGDPHEALQFAQRAVQLQPRVATFYDSLAAVHQALGDAQAAVADEAIASQLDPDALQWKVRSARYHLDAGDPAAAARIIQDMDLSGLSSQTLSESLQKELESVRLRLKHNNLG